MNKVGWVVIVLVLLGIGVFMYYAGTQTPSADAAVRDVVTDFGASLDQVSLLASEEESAEAMATAYGPYVSADLLAQWQQDPSSAPGRTTSSPSPDRIEITSVSPDGEAYLVLGSVIEVTSTGEAGSYPVSAHVEQDAEGEWRITEFSGYPPESPADANDETATAPEEGPITVEGEMVCLPHVDTTGPQTLECAIGMRADDGRYYALSDADAAVTGVAGIATGTRVRASGTFETRADSQYQDVGVIIVTDVAEL